MLAAHGSNPGNSSNIGKLMHPPHYHHMWVSLPRTHHQTRGKYWIMIFGIRKKPFFISNFKLRQEGREKLWLLLLETPKKGSGLLRCPGDKRFTRFRQLHQRCFQVSFWRSVGCVITVSPDSALLKRMLLVNSEHLIEPSETGHSETS